MPDGTRIGWYEVDGVLGQGGFGITYRAIDRNLERRVAIKEFFPIELVRRARNGAVKTADASDEATYAARLNAFLTEARTLALFNHPNIVRVLSVFEANGTAYIVMAYELGQSLEQLYEAGGIDEQTLRAIIGPLTDGLHELHREGFIHRDIKPANIYVRHDGSPILLDFGSARRAFGLSPSSVTCTISPGYTPYEQFAEAPDASPQGPWTDIYALAATLYRCVCGHKPVHANVRAAALLRGMPDPLLPATEHAHPSFSKGFLQAIDAGLAFDPSDRPACLSDWCESLNRVASGSHRGARSTTGRHPPAPADRNSTLRIRSWLQRRRSRPARNCGGDKNTSRIPLVAATVGFSLTAIAALHGLEDSFPATPVTSSMPSLPSMQLETTQATSVQPQFQVVSARAQSERPWQDTAPSLRSTSLSVSPASTPSTEMRAAPLLYYVDEPATALATDHGPFPDEIDSRSTPPPAAYAHAVTMQTFEQPDRSEPAHTGQITELQRRRKTVQDLLTLAEADLQAYRLTSPSGNNALHRFDEILALEPDNAAARAGRERIVLRYLELVESMRTRKRFDEARLYLSKARALQPDSADIGEAQQRLARAQSLERAAEARQARQRAVPAQPKLIRTRAPAKVDRPQAPAGSTPKVTHTLAPIRCPLSRARS
ncbi:MAG: protein kinase domain-containing protein [Gammaproteobacteria bacterium]